jgi:peptidoglycan biosynthesis protein MviN/MurJ (putative lipid II flippase)
MVLFVAAWGIARRQRATWAIGLLPTAGVVALALWFYSSPMDQEVVWLTIWVVDIGVLVGGCLLCWACDVLFGGGARRLPE